MWKHFAVLAPVLLSALLLCQCRTMGTGNLGGPSVAERDAAISGEATGTFYYGRRYYVEKTRFWGYLREPRQPWSKAKLVMMNEQRKHVPDRLPEAGPPGQRYGYDNNYEYRIHGQYTGRMIYDPNSNQRLPEFQLTGYELLQAKPGWIFRPDDRYDSRRITLLPR
jgi:hypothetical protein